MKILLPKTLLEPGTIPWADMNQAFEPTEIEKLLNELLNETGCSEVDMEELLERIDERIMENSKRLEDIRRWTK
jgi:hypothetical protein